MYRKFLLISLVLSLLGCAAKNIPADYAMTADSGNGVAIGTITHTGGGGAFMLYVTSKSSDEKYRMQHGEGQTLNIAKAFMREKPNPDLDITGSPFAVDLPAGRYVINRWQIHQGSSIVNSTEPMGIEFTVEAGKAIYLGNFHFVETSRFVRVTTGATLALSNRSERDLPAIRKNFPALSSQPLEQTIAPTVMIQNLGGTSDGRISIPIFIRIAR